MSDRIFGWSLPPGVSTLPGEEYIPCEDCRNIDDNGNCPAGDSEKPDWDMCPVVNFIDKCDRCGKSLKVLMKYMPKEHIVCEYFSGEPIYCCSKECADKVRLENDKNAEAEEKARKQYEELADNLPPTEDELRTLYHMGIISKEEYEGQVKCNECGQLLKDCKYNGDR